MTTPTNYKGKEPMNDYRLRSSKFGTPSAASKATATVATPDDTGVQAKKVKDIMQSDLTDEQFQEGKDMINSFQDIFSKGDGDKQDKPEEGSDSDTTSEDESDSENHFIVNSDGYLDSDRIITEESIDPDVDETQLEDNNREAVKTTDPHGDAHTATQAEQEESVHIESAPVEESDGQQDDTPEADISLESDDSDNVPVRRSTRSRKPPAWYTSGDYDISKSAVSVQSEWKQKIDCITDLVQSDLFVDMKSEAARTILDILKTSTHTDK
ncbi:protein starmaker-like [Mytilus californianus]|uniref:protein starmaker-like n=1 Tax=Mytilus californianus TaxID=6549 RepID=UPI00224587EF|nr:protein starmaker-like [Mytilus californianus]